MLPPDRSQNTSEQLAVVQENFVRHIQQLRGFVYSLVPRRQLVDDVVQETFITACQKAATFSPDSNFRAWVFTIARYKVMAILKREGHRQGLLDAGVVNLLADQPDNQGNLQERVTALHGCVAKLGGTTQRAVVLRYAENLGPAKIAEEMGWSANALNVALSRARLFLRRCVEETLRREKAY